MTQKDTVAQEQMTQTEIRHKLLENGYVPLANKDKRCMLPGWPRIDVDHDTIDEWDDRRGLKATGLRMEGDLIALDFDINDVKMLDRIWDAIWDKDEKLGDRLNSLPLRAGKGAKVCLFARLETGKIDKLWSKAFYKPEDLEADPAGAVLHRLEVFTGSGDGGARQVGVYGAHTVGERGEVEIEYRWADGWGLADIPIDELPSLRRKDVFTIVDTVSETMSKAGWEYEVSAVSGRVTETRSMTLLPTMRFTTNRGDVLDLEGLEAAASADLGLRVSLGFVEKGAVNVTRGLVGINPADDRVQIWDTATATLYRPADLSIVDKLGGIGAGLQRRGLLSPSGAPTVTGALGGNVRSEQLKIGEGGEADEDSPEILVNTEGRCLVTVGDGDLAKATWLTGAWLAQRADLFQRGGMVTRVIDGGQMLSMDTPRLAVEIGGAVCCVREEKAGKTVRMVEVDAPLALVRQVGSVVGEVGFRELRGVVDVPVIRRDGSVLNTDGWDKESRLVVRVGNAFADCGLGDGEIVTDKEADRALAQLMHPFRAFPLEGAESKGALLAALLTAVVRPALPTAPAFALDAPAAGSGKTLLGQCLMALAGGGTLYAPLPVRQEDEVAKVLLSVLTDKPKAALFDNQIGLLDSASLAAVLTSAEYSGRILGQTKQVQIDTGLMVLFSGNNMTIVGDMTRRVLRVRIDPECEMPAMREFDFDPLQEVVRNRRDMVVSALKLIRWAMQRREGAGKGRIGSFEVWDEIVGQTVAAVAEDGYMDPKEILMATREADPRLEVTAMLMNALRDVFGSCWFTAADIMDAMSMRVQGHSAVQAVLEDELNKVSSVSVGLMLRYRKDTRVDGLRLVVHKPSSKKKSTQFRIHSDEDENVVSFSEWSHKSNDRADKIKHLKTPK